MLEDYSKATCAEFAKLLLYDREVEPRTIHCYNYLSKRGTDYFESICIVDIKRTHIIEFIRRLQRMVSKATGKPLSSKTTKHYQDALRALLN